VLETFWAASEKGNGGLRRHAGFFAFRAHRPESVRGDTLKLKSLDPRLEHADGD
jgi:hypothetical protein